VYLVKMAQRSPSDDARVRTDMRDPSKISVVQTVSTIASTLVAIITVALAMKRAGLSTESSLGVAAILTIIIALATQSLAQEIVASMVFMFERRAVVGDSVVIYSKDAPTPIAGVVSNIGVSSISVRRMDKSLAHVPFTGISCVVNESENDQLAVVEVPVDAAYGPARAVVEAKRVCDMMRDDENISRFIQGAPYVHGVTAPMPHYFNIVVCVPCRERHKISVTNYTRLVLLSEFARLNIPHPPTVLSIATNPK
jgi:small-conductance mechanosensitive channel